MDLNDAYENGAYIKNAETYPPKWAQAAANWRARAGNRDQLALSYGADERQKLDMFLPDNPPVGLVVFVHGGYWRAFDRSDWSHLAAGALARGWAVAMPSYRLAPGVRISEITDDVAAAVAEAAARVDGPIVLTGHSAGGHLVARMVCPDAALPEAVSSRITRVMSISPLSDLRPFLPLRLNDDFRLDEAEAKSESPVLHPPKAGVVVNVWVGSAERPAFLDQARWLTAAWAGATLNTAVGKHHFDVIDQLEDSDSEMVATLLGN